jgi:hypothetical protein
MNDLPPLNRPAPIPTNLAVVPFTKRKAPHAAVDDLVAGRSVLVRDFYSSGLLVLAALRQRLPRIRPDDSYAEQRKSRATFREVSHRLLLQVRDHRLVVRKAPVIGWFSILYPDTDEFLIPFGQVQGLNSAWQWYRKGISIPVLPGKIFPFFGTYFPTRFEHLLLLDSWLNGYDGSRVSAIDVGVGSGVITYQLLNHGFAQVSATDSNPNAIYGMQADLTRRNITAKVQLFYGDLLADCNRKADLIVFNPPWLPSVSDSEGLDKAIYYDADLFPRFFAQAVDLLQPEGRVVLLFSNLAQINGLTESHPIAAEIARGGRFQKELMLESAVKAASPKTRRDQHWREAERVELWVLKPVQVGADDSQNP